MKLWIVGRIRDPERWREWEIMGVFDSEPQADAACTRLFDFYMPYTLNTLEPDAIVSNPEGHFPRWTSDLSESGRAIVDRLYAAMTAWYAEYEGTDPRR